MSGLVGVGAVLKHRQLDAGDADHIMEEVHQVFGPLERLEIPVQDDVIPDVDISRGLCNPFQSTSSRKPLRERTTLR